MYTFINELRYALTGRTKLLLAAFSVIMVAGTAVSAPQEQTAPGKADRLQPLTIQANICAKETWPNISADCLETESGSKNTTMRYITVDRLVSPNTTALMRVPVTVDAQVR